MDQFPQPGPGPRHDGRGAGRHPARTALGVYRPRYLLLRLTPASGFAIQQTIREYPQVVAHYAPSEGYFPLAGWAGLAVLCGYAAVALGLAMARLRRRTNE